MAKLTERDIQEIRAVLAQVRECLQQLIAIKKEVQMTKAKDQRQQ